MIKFIKIDENSRVPKYRQIENSIIHNISVGNITINQKIPSINKFSEEFYLSRDTVEKAYNNLKERKIISSVRGKGYYISRTKLLSKINVLFLINKLSSYKMRTYNAFINSIGPNSHTDVHIYHCDESLFLNLLEINKGVYDYYVIMSHFKSENLKHMSSTDEVAKAVSKIPNEKLIIMDNIKLGDGRDIIEVYQDFENDIYRNLTVGSTYLQKYNKLILLFQKKQPQGTLLGFEKFCKDNSFNYEVVNSLENVVPEKGEVYIIPDDRNLIRIMKKIKGSSLLLGKDIGIISYNDTLLKEIIEGGITTISTDFKKMGERLAKMIINNEQAQIENSNSFILRKSL